MTHYLHLAPIIIAGAFGFAVIFERWKSLYKIYSTDAAKFFAKIETLVRKNQVQEALDLCCTNEQALVARVTKTALIYASHTEDELKSQLEIAVIDAQGKASERIGYLAMIANVATLLGLLGTIAGLIASFEAVASADATTKQSLLAAGISTSMNATAMGLLVAIPVMVAYSILSGKATRLMEETDKAAQKIYSLLQERLYDDKHNNDDLSKMKFEDIPSQNKGAA